MKYLLCALALAFPVTTYSATLEWDRNSEADLQDYLVRQCSLAGCTVTMASPIIATVTQPAAGIRPSVVVDIAGKSGQFSVTARDNAVPPNESGLSVPVNFDKVAPATPANLILR